MSVNPDSLSEATVLQVLDERAGPARPLSLQAADAAVQTAVDRALPARRTGFERRRLSVLLVAAALGVTGISAALVLGHRAWTRASATNAVPAPARAAVGQPSREKPERAREAAPSFVAEPPTTPEPSVAANVPDATNSNGSERAPSARSSSALDLLKAANQLRRQARWADAERSYAQVASSYGNTAQGPVAALAAASLRLEHLGDARGALRLYQVALRAASLSAEAELGIADCYRALGDRAAEIAALRRLTAAHPEALFHERALRRLQALEAGKP